jgi:tRNA(Ile)-lysidine synthase
LYLLAELLPRETLVVAHLNHLLRGPDSDADAAFVGEQAARLGLPAAIERIAVRDVADTDEGNLEATARRVRYGWLTRVALEHRAAWVATGHTMNDQAETVLHNLLRGTGLRGLRGIAPRLPLGEGIDVVRPLLRVGRADVEVYLSGRGLPGRQDVTNRDLAYTRNRIRHELLPQLAAAYSPRIVEHLARVAEQAAAACAEEEARAGALLLAAEKPRAGTMIVLDAAVLERHGRAAAREAFRLLWDREGWPAGGLTHGALDRLAGLVYHETPAVDLADGVRATRHGGVIQLRRDVKR